MGGRVGQTVWDSRGITLVAWLLFVGLVSVFVGGDAFWGGWWRRQGWWFFVHLALLFFLLRSSAISEKFVKNILKILLVVLVSLGFVTLGSGYRPTGTVGEANSCGLFAGMLVILLSESKRVSKLFPLGVIGMVLSGSRSVLAGFMVAIFGRLRMSMRVILVLFFVLFLAWFNLDRGMGNREFLWQESVTIWQKSPWVGIGLDNFQDAFTKEVGMLGLNWQKFDQPHSLPLWLLVSTGSVGLGLFGGWLYLVFSSRGGERWKELTTMVLVFSLFQPLLTSVWIYLFVFLALISTRDMGIKPKGLAHPPGLINLRSLVTIGLAAWTWWNVAWFVFRQYLP